MCYSNVVRQELLNRVSHLLETCQSCADDKTYVIPYDSQVEIKLDSFELFVLLNDMTYTKRALDSQSPVALSFRGHRLGDNDRRLAWVLPDYKWGFPVPNAMLEVEYE